MRSTAGEGRRVTVRLSVGSGWILSATRRSVGVIFDPRYLLFLAPALLLALWAQARVKSTFTKFSKIAPRSGHTGASAAREILRAAGLDVAVEGVQGTLTDHYDPRTRTLRLSEPVYGGRSLAALGVAAHEAGHALQHATNYFPMTVRGFVFPAASLGSKAAMPLFFFGLLMSGGRGGGALISAAILIFSAVVAFQVITLPVEFNASRRAIGLLTSSGIIAEDEVKGARAVLSAAALTYVAGALQGIMTLLYMLSRRRD
jgi:Zn-dependent membrane protease YugP